MTVRIRHLGVAGDDGEPERFGQSHVLAVARGHRMPKLPYPLGEQMVRVAVQRELAEPPQREFGLVQREHATTFEPP